MSRLQAGGRPLGLRPGTSPQPGDDSEKFGSCASRGGRATPSLSLPLRPFEVAPSGNGRRSRAGHAHGCPRGAGDVQRGVGVANLAYGILKHKIVDWQRREARDPLRGSTTHHVDMDAEYEETADTLFDSAGGWVTPPSTWASPEQCLETKGSARSSIAAWPPCPPPRPEPSTFARSKD